MIFERFINDKLLKNHVKDIISDFVSTYWSKYSSNHIILRLIVERKEKVGKAFFAGTVIMDLSNALNSIPHNLLITNLNAYSFAESPSNSFILIWNGRDNVLM